MTERRYYSVRTGRNPQGAQYSLPILLKLFLSLYLGFEERGYFQEVFGYQCVDAGFVPGTAGGGIEAYFLRKVRKDDLWPVAMKSPHYSEDDLFDVIELLHDDVSLPLTGRHHSYADCGWHYDTFDRELGQEEYRIEISRLLADYGDGYELSPAGEVGPLSAPGMQQLLDAAPPQYDSRNVDSKVEEAINRFRGSRSSLEDRRHAVRTLADVLEFLKPKLKAVITGSHESALFNIVNNFSIRHHNPEQKTEYDQAVWLSWMFYYYLATIHAVDRLIQKSEEKHL